jgi:hypothetical protein
LLAEFHRSCAEPRVRVLQLFGEITGQRRLGRRPAVVVFAFFDPLLAVVALVRLHRVILN